MGAAVSQGFGSHRNSSVNSLSTLSQSRSIHESLVRERDPNLFDFEDIYTIEKQIGRGGLCNIYKIRKKDDQIGGSSRPENAKPRKPLFYRKKKTVLSRQSRERLDSCGYEMFYALKVINLSLVKRDKIASLKNEVEILKTLDHMHIINAYETFQPRDNRQLMIVMELCTGGDLTSRMPYQESRAAVVVKQIVSAVAYMHDSSVIHRDIKLENVVFESSHPDAPIKLIDFGLSKEYSPKDVLVDRVGTLYSMSPETMQGSYDAKADLWSIGVCTYMLLSNGSKPFEGKDTKELVAKVLKGRYNFEGDEWAEVSELAKSFIDSLLLVDAEQRPSAHEAGRHDWVVSSTTSNHDLDAEFKERVCNSIVRYAEAGPFRKLALNVIAKRSAPRDIGELRKVFDAFDTLNNGKITLQEFQDALAQSQFSQYANDADVVRIFHSLDVNHNNAINYTEFLAACLEVQGELEEYRVAEAFDLLDCDDSGYISRDNLEHVLGQQNDKDYVDRLLAEADPSRHNKVSYSEFLGLFNKKNASSFPVQEVTTGHQRALSNVTATGTTSASLSSSPNRTRVASAVFSPSGSVSSQGYPSGLFGHFRRASSIPTEDESSTRL